MGNFYATAVAVGTDQQSIVAELRDVAAYVSPLHDSYVIAYPNFMALGPQRFSSLWKEVSKSLGVAVLSAAVFDDDVLYYELWVKGELKDRYVSDPSAFEPNSKTSRPEGGNPKALCSVFKCSDVKRLTEVLTAIRSENRYVFETERHEDLARLLGIPMAS
jgi:hypothetical protein